MLLRKLNATRTRIALFNMQFLMVLKAIYFLDQKYGLALNGEPWVIEKGNKVVGIWILPLKIREKIYSYDWVPLIRFSLFTSITIFSNINLFFPF